MSTLYENIIHLCELRGIKGGKMCVDLGISKSLLSDLKAGRKKSINMKTAERIAEYFDVPVDLVIGFGPEAYIQDLEIGIKNLEKKIAATADEDELSALYAELEALQENKSDTEMALALANQGKTKKAPSEDGEMVDLLEELKDRPDLRTLLDAARLRSPEQVGLVAEFMRHMKEET